MKQIAETSINNKYESCMRKRIKRGVFYIYDQHVLCFLWGIKIIIIIEKIIIRKVIKWVLVGWNWRQ